MSTQALVRPLPVRSNRVRDLLFVAVSFVLAAALFQIWHFATQRVLGSTDTASLVAASIFPIAALPMYTRLALGLGPMLVQLIAFALLILAVPARLPLFSAQILIGGLVGGLLVGDPRGRGSVVTAGMASGAAAALVFLVIFGPHMPAPSLIGGALGTIVGGAVAGGLVLALSPATERLLGHVTPLTLIEALSYDHPLLRRLITRAPGTFLHSTNLAIMSDGAARRIGANALVARVGALYHDVGKTLAPENFIENQQGETRVDDRTAEEIARSLIQHVSDGAALIRSFGLGDTVAQFALEHHGTSPMRSLSERAAREGLSNPRALQYPGPRPRSRETAIVMIGDQVEATARVRQPQTRDECLTLARESVARIMADEQLVYSGLTLAELDLIEQAFAETLHAIHHRRLGYAFSDVTPSALVRQELEARPLLPTDA
jgi:putative nucleotidyltransferase with HDIG domain